MELYSALLTLGSPHLPWPSGAKHTGQMGHDEGQIIRGRQAHAALQGSSIFCHVCSHADGMCESSTDNRWRGLHSEGRRWLV